MKGLLPNPVHRVCCACKGHRFSAQPRTWFQHPPRITRYAPVVEPLGSVTAFAPYLLYQSWHHSHTFPCMSYSPKAFGFLSPTGCVLPPEFLSYHAYSPSSFSSSPKQNLLVLPARHAYSHSASVGNTNLPPWPSVFAFSLTRNFWQSSQLTFSTGFFGPLNLLGLLPSLLPTAPASLHACQDKTAS